MHEIRYIVDGLEYRADSRELRGVAVRYGAEAKLPWGRETFAAGAFGRVDRFDVLLNKQHDRTVPLARTGSGLTFEDDATALRFAAVLPKTRDCDDVITLVRERILRGASIEFVAKRESQEGDLRTITRAELVGLAIVDKPAYPASTIKAMRARIAPGRPVRRVWL